MKYSYDEIQPADTFEWGEISDDPRLSGWTDFIEKAVGMVKGRKESIKARERQKEQEKMARVMARQQQAGFAGTGMQPWMLLALGVGAVLVLPRLLKARR